MMGEKFLLYLFRDCDRKIYLKYTFLNPLSVPVRSSKTIKVRDTLNIHDKGFTVLSDAVCYLQLVKTLF